MNLDDLVSRLYRAARSAPDAAWQALLKDAALSLSACAPGAASAVLLLTDTVLSLAVEQGQLEAGVTASLRTALRRSARAVVQPLEQLAVAP